jgi:hypothetical protein
MDAGHGAGEARQEGLTLDMSRDSPAPQFPHAASRENFSAEIGCMDCVLRQPPPAHLGRLLPGFLGGTDRHPHEAVRMILGSAGHHVVCKINVKSFSFPQKEAG